MRTLHASRRTPTIYRGQGAVPVCTALLVFLMTASLPGAQAVVSFPDFSDLSTLTLNGVTSGLNPNAQNVLRLTNDLNQSGSGFLTNPISLAADASFSTNFQFQILDPQGISDTDGQGADGIVFVVQTVANNVGGGGGGIGYLGIPNSVGIEFDSWNNGSPDDNNGNHVGIDLNGSVDSVVQANLDVTTVGRLNNGAVWTAWVDYDGSTDTLEVRIATNAVRPALPLLSQVVDLPAVLGSTNAFVGFTSGTGGAGGDHEILNWLFVNEFKPLTEICGDSIDNDGDGSIDCADNDCALEPACAPPRENCTDHVDNDRDQLIDCEDPDCATDAACAAPVDRERPLCRLLRLTKGPPATIEISIQDLGSGLASIQVTKAVNVSVLVPVFNVGTTDPQVVIGTKIDQKKTAQIAIRAIDVAGNTIACDPVLVEVEATQDGFLETVTDVPEMESWVTIQNGTPGLRTLDVSVNGLRFEVRDLQNGEVRTLDVLSAMVPGDQNEIILASKDAAGRATIMISDGVPDSTSESAAFVRGDVNEDAGVDLSDPIALLSILFYGAQIPSCPDSGDANDDGELNLTDVIYLLSYQFRGGPSPAAPGLSCGDDPSADQLDCVGHRGCQ